MMWTAGETESDVTAELNQGESVNLSGHVENTGLVFSAHYSIYCGLHRYDVNSWGDRRRCYSRTQSGGSLWISLDMLRIRVQCSVHTTVYTAVCTDMMWTAGRPRAMLQQNSIRGGVCESLWTCWEYGSSVQCTLQYILLSAQIWWEQLGRPRAMLQQNLSFITRRSLCHLWVWETYASVVHVHYNITFLTLLKMYSSPPFIFRQWYWPRLSHNISAFRTINISVLF